MNEWASKRETETKCGKQKRIWVCLFPKYLQMWARNHSHLHMHSTSLLLGDLISFQYHVYADNIQFYSTPECYRSIHFFIINLLSWYFCLDGSWWAKKKKSLVHVLIISHFRLLQPPLVTLYSSSLSRTLLPNIQLSCHSDHTTTISLTTFWCPSVLNRNYLFWPSNPSCLHSCAFWCFSTTLCSILSL